MDPPRSHLHDDQLINTPNEEPPEPQSEIAPSAIEEEEIRVSRLSNDSTSSHDTIHAASVRPAKLSTGSPPSPPPSDKVEVPLAVSERVLKDEDPSIPHLEPEPDTEPPACGISETASISNDSSRTNPQSTQEIPFSPSPSPSPVLFPRPKPISTTTPPQGIMPSPATNDSFRKSSGTLSHTRNSVSLVHITTAIDMIAASKEAKKAGPLKDSIAAAQDVIHSGHPSDRPRIIFEPLRLACETRNEKLLIASLDCTSKLISHSFLTEASSDVENYASPPASPAASSTSQNTSLADLVTHTITSAYSESIPDAVSLQIVKAILSLVLSPTILGLRN